MTPFPTFSKLPSLLGANRRTKIIVGLIVLLWAFFIWPTPYRYYKSGDRQMRENRFTGDVKALYLRGWQ